MSLGFTITEFVLSLGPKSVAPGKTDLKVTIYSRSTMFFQVGSEGTALSLVSFLFRSLPLSY